MEGKQAAGIEDFLLFSSDDNLSEKKLNEKYFTMDLYGTIYQGRAKQANRVNVSPLRAWITPESFHAHLQESACIS